MVIWLVLVWGTGAVMIIGTPFALAAHDRSGFYGYPLGLAMIAGGIGLRNGVRDGRVVLETVDLDGQPKKGWVLRIAASVHKAIMVEFAALVTAYLVIFVVARHVAGHISARSVLRCSSPSLVGAARDVRGGRERSLSLTPDGLLVRRAGRSAFAPWSTIEDSRSTRWAPQWLTAIRFRFSDPDVAKSMRKVRPHVPLILNRRWHLYWSVFGTGVEGRRLAKTIMLCAHNPLARTQVGTEHGLVALGLVGAGGIEPPTFSL